MSMRRGMGTSAKMSVVKGLVWIEDLEAVKDMRFWLCGVARAMVRMRWAIDISMLSLARYASG